jgi:hypothetical protein
MDLETFYHKINKSILLISICAKDKELVKVIKSCRLKPINAFGKGFVFTTKLYNKWIDEFGNALNIDKKQQSIILNDKENEDLTVKTDLFFGVSLKYTIENGHSVLFMRCEDISILSIYGKDEYLRTFIVTPEFKRISPLIMGIETTKQFLLNIDKPYTVILENVDCIISKSIECITFPLFIERFRYDTLPIEVRSIIDR